MKNCEQSGRNGYCRDCQRQGGKHGVSGYSGIHECRCRKRGKFCYYIFRKVRQQSSAMFVQLYCLGILQGISFSNNNVRQYCSVILFGMVVQQGFSRHDSDDQFLCLALAVVDVQWIQRKVCRRRHGPGGKIVDVFGAQIECFAGDHRRSQETTIDKVDKLHHRNFNEIARATS